MASHKRGKKKTGTARSIRSEQCWAEIDPSGLYARAGTWLLDLPQVVGWYDKGTYTGHTLKRRENGWLLILRMEQRGKPMVAFQGGDDPEDCVREMARKLRAHRAGFRPDLYVSTVRENKKRG